MPVSRRKNRIWICNVGALRALAEFERELISERTKAGMASAKRNGKHIGRPRKLSSHQVAHARKLMDSGKKTRGGVAALFGVDVVTLRRALRVVE